MKKLYCLIAGISCACILSGCSQVKDLTAEQNNQIAEYAAGILINRTELSNGTYVKETKEAETTQNPAINPQEESSGTEETTEAPSNILDCADKIGISPLKITYDSYILSSEYPETEDALFTFKPDDGYKLLVVNLKLSNETSESVTANTSQNHPVFKIAVNSTKKYNNYGNLLLNDLSNLKDFSVDPNSERDVVLVFMVEDKDTEALNSIELSCCDGGKSLLIK